MEVQAQVPNWFSKKTGYLTISAGHSADESPECTVNLRCLLAVRHVKQDAG